MYVCVFTNLFVGREREMLTLLFTKLISETNNGLPIQLTNHYTM